MIGEKRKRKTLKSNKKKCAVQDQNEQFSRYNFSETAFLSKYKQNFLNGLVIFEFFKKPFQRNRV